MSASAAIARLGDLLSWGAQQPGSVRADVLTDPEKTDGFGIAEHEK